MIIQRIHINNFGIIRNQTLEDIGGAIVVIGGLNRAGKSTFLHILRCLGYGFARSGPFSSPRGTQEVEGDIVLDSGDIYNIRISGYGNPVLRCVRGDSKISSGLELYNNIDSFTYRQLFTISLDELQRIPKGIDGQRNTEKLQSILLGAGLSDILQVPSVEEKLRREADKIGGRIGSPSVKTFKPYNERIKAGVRQRKEALSQVEQYAEGQGKLKEIEAKIEDGESALRLSEDKETLLDVLKNNYKDYYRKKDLQRILQEPVARKLLEEFSALPVEKLKNLRSEYDAVLGEHNEQVRFFGQRVGSDNIEAAKKKLLGCEEALQRFWQQLSGLEARMQTYFEEREFCQRTRDRLIGETKHINQSWSEKFDEIMEIRADYLERDLLNQHVENYKSWEREIKDQKSRIAELEEERKGLENAAGAISAYEPGASLKRYFFAATLFIIGGVASFFVLNIWAGVESPIAGILGGILSLAGVIGMGVYVFVKHSIESNKQSERRKIELEIDKKTTQVENERKKIAVFYEELSLYKEGLQHYRKIMGLPEEVSPDSIKEIFRSVCDLKLKIRDWQNLEERVKKNSTDLESELGEIACILEKTSLSLGGDLGNTGKSSKLRPYLERSDEIIAEFRQAWDKLEIVQKLDGIEQEKGRIEKEILHLLGCSEEDIEDLPGILEQSIASGESAAELKVSQEDCKNLEQRILQSLKSDRVRRVLERCQEASYTGAGDPDSAGEPVFTKDAKDIKSVMGMGTIDDSSILRVFDSFFNEYTSLDDVTNAYDEARYESKSIRSKMNKLKEEALSLKDELRRLATTQNLEKAQKQIDEGRAELRPLAERYAVYRASAFILEQVQRRFREKSKDVLLDQASKILSKITAADYEKILPPDNFTEADFKAQVRDGAILDTADVLSRGTREQLFLAVRISRIQEINPPLPVIFDDTLVNFDAYHLDQAVSILADLAARNQVFVLTCHPELVRYTAAHAGGGRVQYWKLAEGVFTLSGEQELVAHLTKN